MNSSNIISRRVGFGIAVCLSILAFTACEYEVPITSSPTRNVQERLLGDWISLDDNETMKVRQLDDNIHIVYFDGDLFRAYHSDVTDTPFVSVQGYQLSRPQVCLFAWNLSDDGKHLRLRSVQSKLMPKEQKDSARVAELLKEKANSPELFGEEIQFSRVK